ncbi:hypothetical protein [Flavobacterium columnare]|uniref:Uncharacterized protein n=1 Tax=Flavobacterium columnare (strain ATCC 49512 / CIP 103533 / TG 44/87) TaxID=1041826 RepID=G8XA61_FLACA|nr:hypothetical protein [Flavobacterium columnare]AEW85919.1 hypothetical protein FCOL_05470 [Flavobacterium columnare ATCC 49512]
MKASDKYMSWCLAHKIRIYPVPVRQTSKGEYYLVVERNGRGSKGQQVFRDKPLKGEKTWWEQINALYQLIYEKENKSV